jgi:hypothetical protein
MNSYLKSFLLVIAVSFSLAVSGQINFKKGFVITLQNDTLYGRINDRGGYANAKLCVFHQKKGPTFRYAPQDIKAYRMMNDKYYVARKVSVGGKDIYSFIDVLIKGEVSLYHNWKNKDQAYYIEKKDKNMVGLINEEMILRYKPEGNVAVVYSPTYILNNRIYKDTLSSFFSDSKKAQAQIKGLDYDAKALTKITKTYISDICKGNNCINYERDLRAYTPRFGIMAGIQRNEISFLPSAEEHRAINAKDFYSNPLGLFVNFPFTKINDRLSFQLEAIYTERVHNEDFLTVQNFATRVELNTQTIGFPLMLKYQIGRGFISPSFAVGKEMAFVIDSKVKIVEPVIDKENPKDYAVHPIQKGGWLAEVGLNFKFAKHLTLFTNLRYEIGQNQILINGHYHSSYNTALHSAFFVKEYETTYTTLLCGFKF